MARNYVPIYTTIWDNPEFVALSRGAQQVYFLVISQPEMAYTGVVPFTIRRWSRYAGDSTEETLRTDLAELSRSRFVVLDEATEELWVRSFIRHSKVLDQPNVAKSMFRQYESIHSQAIKTLVWEQLPAIEQKTRPKPLATPSGNPSPDLDGGPGVDPRYRYGLLTDVSTEPLPIPRSSSASEEEGFGIPVESLLDDTWMVLAKRKKAMAQTPIVNFFAWCVPVVSDLKREHESRARKLVKAQEITDAETLAEMLEPSRLALVAGGAATRPVPRPWCDACDGTTRHKTGPDTYSHEPCKECSE